MVGFAIKRMTESHFISTFMQIHQVTLLMKEDKRLVRAAKMRTKEVKQQTEAVRMPIKAVKWQTVERKMPTRAA
ncbi:hypothetical protein BRIN106911_19915 [Brevibacillus invocatus]|nr:hypothetical protein [Brevibacillus sp. AY1]